MAKGGNAAVVAPAAPPSPPKVNTLSLFTTAFGSADGYGNSAEQMAMALERRGVTVSLAGPTRPTGFLNAPHFLERESAYGQSIVWYSLAGHWERQQNKRPSFGFSMYETDKLPMQWIERLNNVDEIWVPCIANGDLFAGYTSRPVHVIPLGVDSEAFKFKRRVRGEKLRFLCGSTFATELRKNIAGAISAFLAAFPGRDDVELIVRSTHGIFDTSDPRVKIDNGIRQTSELADLYRSCDAYLAPSFGEGFGLTPLEAMATGMPAIFTNAFGMADYAELGMPVPAYKTPALTGHGVAPFGNWYQIDMDLFVDRIREVDEHYDRVMAQAQKDAATIARVWTWDRTAQLIQARLEA